MPAYVIARLTVSDPEVYQRYALRSREVITSYEGRILASSNAPEVLEGDEPRSRVVLLTFPTADVAREWYHSPPYQEITADRRAAWLGVDLRMRAESWSVVRRKRASIRRTTDHK